MSRSAPQIAANFQSIRERIDAACVRSRRSTESVQLVAVTKYAELSWARELLQLGALDLGESRPQQLIERAPLLGESVRWHLVGQLQRNKVRRVLPYIALLHSVDSLRLAESVDRIASELDLRPRVLLEVNVSGESAKGGFAIDELQSVWSRLVEYRNLQLDGLMTMAPLTEDAEQARPIFRKLREVRDQLVERSDPPVALPQLSMGMSGDFEIAIEEGATLVRIGSALFTGLSQDV